MSYDPTNWTDGISSVDASNLNKLEQAVSENSSLIEQVPTIQFGSRALTNDEVINKSTSGFTITFEKQFSDVPYVFCTLGVNAEPAYSYGDIQLSVGSRSKSGFTLYVSNNREDGKNATPVLLWLAIL